ncbi:unnamed protein product [Onchocerca flexuosa]|uniref:ABC transporter permease n=1 Tax=Onchocerca flexuosa TaxID=387005 RepID=A0A183H0I3_9BILA|nr:unnamed protein product [Onchocerca flexuosa]
MIAVDQILRNQMWNSSFLDVMGPNLMLAVWLLSMLSH